MENEMLRQIMVRKDEESEDDYIFRICGLKEELGWTWDDIAGFLNQELDYNHTESKYRRQYQAFLKGYYKGTKEHKEAAMDNSAQNKIEKTAETVIDKASEEEYAKLLEAKISLGKEKTKYSDLRNQINRHIRYEARSEVNKELAISCAQLVAKEKNLLNIEPFHMVPSTPEKAGILCLSDVHYGIAFKNFLNEYSPEIARQRLSKLVTETIRIGVKEGIKTLYFANLGDLIAGMIHLQIRLESRENVVQQTMHIAEILAEMLATLANYFTIEYYDCLDNHSRIDSNKETSVAMESYTYFIPWYLKSRLENHPNICIHSALIDDDIMKFTVLGHKVIGVHGHRDKPANIVKELTCLTRDIYDLAIMGHRHHFSADEQQGTVVVSNGSLMGTDDYAKDLRVSSRATQNLIIATQENVCESIYRICVD